MNTLIDEVYELLRANGITRGDTEIRNAIQSAAEGERDREGIWIDPEVIRRRDDHWHSFLHAPGGVLDLLEIDSEDELYDRVHPQILPEFRLRAA